MQRPHQRRVTNLRRKCAVERESLEARASRQAVRNRAQPWGRGLKKIQTDMFRNVSEGDEIYIEIVSIQSQKPCTNLFYAG